MRKSTDYIPTYAELERQREAQKKYMTDHATKARTFKVSYTLDDKRYTEIQKGDSSVDLEKILVHNCSMVGWIPRNIHIVEVDAE